MRGWRCILAAWLLLFCGPVRAQTAPAGELCAPPGASNPAVTAQKNGPDNSLRLAQSYVDQATKAYQSERYEDAIRALRLAYALRPRPDILFNLAQSCRELGQQGAALTLFERVASEPTEGALRTEALRTASELREREVERVDAQAKQLLEEKKAAQAISAWEGAYLVLPKPLFLFRIAQAQGIKGELSAALATYERFLQADPNSELKAEAEEHILHLRALLLDAAAQRSAQEQRYGQAIAEWDGAYKLDPAAIYLYRRAEVEGQAGLFREALSSYTRFLSAEPSTPLRTEIERACQKLKAQLLEQEADRLFSAQSYAQASHIFAEAESLSPHPMLLFRHAEAERLSGQPESARILYKRFLAEPAADPAESEYRALAEQRLADLARQKREAEQRKLRPLYQRWWLWTTVAAVVTVGVVAGVVIGTQVTVEPSYPNLRIVSLTGALHEP